MDRYNVGCTKRMGLFHPEKNKQVNNWRRKSQGRASIEAKKQVLPHGCAALHHLIHLSYVQL